MTEQIEETEENNNVDSNTFGIKFAEITHFYNKRRSNQLSGYIDKPYYKDGKYLKSGSIRIVTKKFGDDKKEQMNVIKLSYQEACELRDRLGHALQEMFRIEFKLELDNNIRGK